MSSCNIVKREQHRLCYTRGSGGGANRPLPRDGGLEELVALWGLI